MAETTIKQQGPVVRTLRAVLRSAVRVAALLVCTGAAIRLFGCAESALFYPDAIMRATPDAYGLAYTESPFEAEDGTHLQAWFIPAATVANPRDALGTVIQFHGNAQNMTAHWRLVDWLPRQGFNVFVFDYRGYGASEGSPSVNGLLLDCTAALQHVRSLPQVDPSKLLILGQSLGGTNAIVAVAHDGGAGVRAIAIESTFSSYSRIANDKIPGSGVLISDRLAAEAFVPLLERIPLLWLHGTDDQVIPMAHSERLHAAATGPSQLVIVPGAGHLEVFEGPHGDANRRLLVRFYREALGLPPE